jgi:hypothetical protein
VKKCLEGALNRRSCETQLLTISQALIRLPPVQKCIELKINVSSSAKNMYAGTINIPKKTISFIHLSLI